MANVGQSSNPGNSRVERCSQEHPEHKLTVVLLPQCENNSVKKKPGAEVNRCMMQYFRKSQLEVQEHTEMLITQAQCQARAAWSAAWFYCQYLAQQLVVAVLSGLQMAAAICFFFTPLLSYFAVQTATKHSWVL